MKKRKKKLSDLGIKLQREKTIIIILISITVLLALFIAYDVYKSFETKGETDFLNGAVISLSKDKSQLLLEIEDLNQTVDTLTAQKLQLNADNSNLASDLSDLQDEYDALEEDLQTANDNLDDCEELLP